jgi:hypothetical protein
VVASYDSDIGEAAAKAFDRETLKPIPVSQLKSYREVLRHYHLHPEDKFENGDYFDSGVTKRRHIVAHEVEVIGKESNFAEEQVALGVIPQAQVIYERRVETDEQRASFLSRTRDATYNRGLRKVARQLDVNPGHLSRALRGTRPITPALRTRLEEWMDLNENVLKEDSPE